MKRIVILLIAIGGLLNTAQATDSHVKDSLLRLYVASPADTTRLDLLYQLSLLDQRTPTFIYYQDKLLKEATAQKNILYQSIAIYMQAIYYYNRLDMKHTLYWLNRLDKLAEENNLYVHYFRGKKMLIELYIIHQQPELAINEAEKMYAKAEKLENKGGMREACLCMMTALFTTYQYKEGIGYLKKAFDLLVPESSLYTRLDLNTKGVLAYSCLHDNENMFPYLEEMNRIRLEIQGGNPALNNGFDDVNLFTEIHYALYYTRACQPRMAWKYLTEAENYRSSTTFVPYLLILYATYAEYYQLINAYDKALENIDKAIELAKPISPDDALNYGLMKGSILLEMGRGDDALSVYNRVAEAKDSTSAAFSNSQMKQIEELYDMDALLRQKEERQATFHRICLGIAVCVIIVLLFINVHTLKSRRRLQRDEKEMRRLALIAEEANEMKGRFLANMSYNIRIPLNNVVGFSQLLSVEKNLSEKERKEYSAIIQANSNELIQLVNDVLDLSRLEADMMKYQMQDYSLEEWCSELVCTAQMRSEGIITLDLQADVTTACVHADVTRLTQFIMNMTLYPIECKEPRIVKMTATVNADSRFLTCRIENSPMTDPEFASQRVSVRHDIHRLFFEHFNGTYRIEQAKEGELPAITFTYPTL